MESEHTNSPYQMNYQAENMYVHFPPGITINILLQNTRNKMGNSFLTYSARDNNCQNFLISVENKPVVDCFVNKIFLSLDNPLACNKERTKF